MAGITLGGHLRPPVHGNGRRLATLGDIPKVPRELQQLAKRATGTISALKPRSSCKSGDTSSACETPVSSANLTVIITVCVIAAFVIAFFVLIYLHRRNKQKQKLEDNDAKYKSMDFGMGVGGGAGKKRRSKFFGGDEKPSHAKGLSMDMNLSSPYLLPPDIQQSRESLRSLAKTLHGSEADPYRHIDSFVSNDAASMRSFPRGADRSSNTPSKLGGQPLPRQKSFPTAPLPQAPGAIKERESSRMAPEMLPPASAPPSKTEFRFTDDDSAAPPQIQHVDMPAMPEIQEPAPVAQRDAPSISRPPSTDPASIARERNSFRDSSALPAADLHHGQADGLGIMDPEANVEQTPLSLRPGRKDAPHVVSEVPSVYEYTETISQYDDHHEGDDEPRGRQMNDKPRENPEPAGLGVPKQNNKRLSVGLRPLPPSDYLASEDPEFRANRIRSFYKEYFDDSNEQRPPMPQPQSAEYVEDYDSNYMGDAAYFDPESNAFVMPYAQPVTRRAMTPPPSNRRPMPRPGPGPRRGPPGPSAMGPGQRPRAGSVMSARFAAPSPRPGSSASARMGRGTPGPKRPLPPPVILSTLPTPSKLRDDSFAIMGAIEFAPPPTLRDQAAGRSQSPLGERRPYQLNTPVAASPLFSSFDDMAALPSPHLLRKSGTFTALDFAPPRRFKDPENMSDSGSVRSMGSGISARTNNAIRGGAGRVSRLPGDQVFTAAAQEATLKPKWGMRD